VFAHQIWVDEFQRRLANLHRLRDIEGTCTAAKRCLGAFQFHHGHGLTSRCFRWRTRGEFLPSQRLPDTLTDYDPGVVPLFLGLSSPPPCISAAPCRAGCGGAQLAIVPGHHLRRWRRC
jgi:hypothetical protein